MHTSAARAMLALGAPKPHPVRKVAHLLCDSPSPPVPSPPLPSPPSPLSPSLLPPAVPLPPSSPAKRPRVAQWTRGLRGRFVERPFAPMPPTLPGPPGVSQMPARVTKRAAKKYYANPTPSAHCHVCARTAKAVRFAVCARIAHGLCRKVICDKCFSKFGWDWDAAIADPQWTCVHCRGVCPEGRSQCFIYSRVNRRRETKRGARAAAAARAQAALELARAGAVVKSADGLHGAAPPRFGDAGFASQHSPGQRSNMQPQAAAGAVYPPLAPPYSVPETSYSRTPQRVHGHTTQRALPSLLRPDPAPTQERLPCSPLPPLPPVAVPSRMFSSVSSLSKAERSSIYYGSLSPGSDVTATSNDAELRHPRALPPPLQR